MVAARNVCGWRRLQLDPLRKRALQPGGASIDFSGIAKGYAVDRVAAVLHEHGIADFLVEVGGELRGAGIKPDGDPWWVAVERPPAGAGTPASADDIETLVALHGLSIATSGDYRRAFDAEGVRYSHTIDPATGYPVAHGVAAVTVVHADCMAADAYATALFVLGPERGFNFARQRGIAALFVVREETKLVDRMTPHFAAHDAVNCVVARSLAWT